MISKKMERVITNIRREDIITDPTYIKMILKQMHNFISKFDYVDDTTNSLKDTNYQGLLRKKGII